MNAQSLVNKIDELRVVVAELKPDLILVNETWTHPDITDAFLKINGYTIIARSDRCDTKSGRGGGLVIYKRLPLCVYELDVSCPFNQIISVSIPSAHQAITLNLVYRSPNSSLENNAQLDAVIRDIKSPSITIGDMNYRNIDWENGSSDSVGRNFFNATQDAFLTQHVDFATHDGNLIDLVLSSNPALISSVEDVGVLGKSHHSMLAVKVNTCPTHIKTEERVPDYSKADFDKLRDITSSIAWSDDLNPLSASEAWDVFKNKLCTAVEECIPLRNRRSAGRPLWMNQNILRVIRKKRRLWKVYQTSQDYADFKAFQDIQKSIAKTIRRAKKKLERKLAKQFKKNSRPFYSYVNSKTKSSHQVGPLKNEHKEIISNNNEMADLLNNYFSTVFTSENDANLPTPVISHNEKLTAIEVDEDMIKSRIHKLKSNSAPGPDKILPRVLQELEDIIVTPLCIIFRKSLAEGSIPSDWKMANVTPVFKKGAKSSVDNYRPISLTSIICKLLESIICEAVTNYLSSYCLIRLSQHGFMSHRSCLTNLLEYLETVTRLLDEGHNVDVFYLDFSKAFDRVPHKRLGIKLANHGIGGKLLHWIQNWLSDRKQRVVLNGSASSWSDVTSGVPQGSVLGPLLFLIYINDIDSAVDTVYVLLLKFADDTKGARPIDSITDAEMMQKDLDNLHAWSIEWSMLFNTDKCHVLHLGNTNPCYEYNINDIKLKVVSEEKDLGVIIHSSGKPSAQVAAAALKANSVLGQLLRAFTYRDKHTYIKLYKQYVRPHLEFCVQAWSPWLKQDIELLENVQRRAVHAVCGLTGSYEEKLQIIGLPSLEERRIRGDMIQTFKIINMIDNVSPTTFFQLSSQCHAHSTRGATCIADGITTPGHGLVQLKSHLNLRKYFFSQRVVGKWNNLPTNVTDSTSVDGFKSAYDNYLSN